MTALLLSPAMPAGILLYGFVFVFAGAYYIGIPWQRTYTTVLYAVTVIWVLVAVIGRFRVYRPRLNRIDLLFTVFLMAVLLSIGLNWWDGTTKYLKLMPAFFLAPYVVGRLVRAKDGYILRNVTVFLGGLLIVIILPEYLRILRDGLPYVNSPTPMLFGLNHGVMLSGILLSVSLLSLVSIVLSPDCQHSPGILASRNGRYFSYALMLLIVVTVGWVSSRGPAITGIIGVSIVLTLAPAAVRRRKIEILLVLALGLSIAVAHSMQSKSNAEYYALLLSSPVKVEQTEEVSIEGFSSVRPNTSIFGESVCERIVDSVSDRWVHYQQALNLFLKNPLFGVGANHYGDYACTGPGSFPHTTILQVFAELGSFVGLGYCVLLGWSLFALFRGPTRLSVGTIEPVWQWFAAYSVVQIALAQLNGDYFISASMYFAMGVAASTIDPRVDMAVGS